MYEEKRYGESGIKEENKRGQREMKSEKEMKDSEKNTEKNPFTVFGHCQKSKKNQKKSLELKRENKMEGSREENLVSLSECLGF